MDLDPATNTPARCTIRLRAECEPIEAHRPETPASASGRRGTPMPQTRPMSELSNELAPAIEQLLERHLASTKEWFPHRLVPWSRGRDFAEDEADDAWRPEPGTCSDAARVA